MKRANELIKNFFVYGFAEFISKIIPFLCLPIITRLMPDTAAFGVYNMFTIVLGLGITFVVLNINTVIFREYFDDKKGDVDISDSRFRYNVTTTAQKIVFLNSIVFSLILIIFSRFFSELFFNDALYRNVVIFSGIAVFLTSNSYIIECPTKLQNQRLTFVFSKLLGSIGYYLVLLLFIYLGFTYYSIIYTSIFTTILLIIYFWKKNKDFFLFGRFDRVIAKKMLTLGISLLPASIMYWIYSGISTIMISKFLDLSELGIYSFGLKIARIGYIFTNVLMGGLNHFIFSSMQDHDYPKVMGTLWELMFVFTTVCYLILFVFKDFIFYTFFSGDYLLGIEVFPFLLIVPFTSLLRYILFTQFTVIKKPIYNFVFICIECLCLLFLCYILISFKGIVGVAIANVFASFVALFILIFVVKKKKLVLFSKNINILITAFVFLFVFIIFFSGLVESYTSIFCYLVIVSSLYFRKAISYVKSIKK